MNDLTPKQEEVLEKVAQLLSEHFEASIVLVESGDDDDKCVLYTRYDGGRSRTIGMLELKLADLKHEFVTQKFRAEENE